MFLSAVQLEAHQRAGVPVRFLIEVEIFSFSAATKSGNNVSIGV